MTFPSIAAQANSSTATAGTDHTVALPTGIAAGDLLIAFLASDSNRTITFPAGWTSFAQIPSFGDFNSFRAAWRIADGGEGASINVTTSAAEETAHACYRIAAATWKGTGAGIVIGTNSAANDASPDPSSLTSGFGAVDTLWIALYVWNVNAAHSAYPAGYTLGQHTGAGAAEVSFAISAKQANAASEDPGAATIASAQRWGANVIAVEGVVGGDITLTGAAVTGGHGALAPGIAVEL